jgi:hypothetical protein
LKTFLKTHFVVLRFVALLYRYALLCLYC